MEYPATQMFVSDDDDDDDDDDDEEEGTDNRDKKAKVQVGILIVDSIVHPILKGINKVGRIDSCNIVIKHDTVSKEHAEIEAGTGARSIFISDLGSTNKTKLNDVVLRPGRSYQLQNGDAVRFGSVLATFKLEDVKEQKNLVQQKQQPARNSFVIPETPATVSKDVHLIIPGTPDLSFDDSLQSRSSMEASRSSEVSMVIGIQKEGNMSSVIEVSARDLDADKRENNSFRHQVQDLESMPKINNKHATGSTPIHNTSNLETRENSSLVESDEENIFDMTTQQTNIHDEETQKFDINHTTESHSCCISDLETQKFPMEYIHHSLRESVEKEKSCLLPSINDVATQVFHAPAARNLDNDDSETDEEGLFAKNGDEIADMYDAPTQLIKDPVKNSRLRCEASKMSKNELIDEKSQAARKAIMQLEETENCKKSYTSECTEVHIHKQNDHPSLGVKTHTTRSITPAFTHEMLNSVQLNKGEKVALNDSVENKLNNLFDDVNDSSVEEPTQMLTQHLERILGSTQSDEVVESTKVSSSKVTEPDTGPNSDFCKIKKSDKADETDFQELDIISTQELFDDLPAVTILGTPSKIPSATSRECNTVSLDVTTVYPLNKSEKAELDSFKTSADQENHKKNDLKVSKHIRGLRNMGGSESKVAELSSPKGNLTLNDAKTKGNNHKKPKLSNIGTASISSVNNSDLSVNIDSVIPKKISGSRKKLPPKKQIFPNTSTPELLPTKSQLTPVAVPVQSLRSTKQPTVHKDKTSIEAIGRRSTRSMIVDSANVGVTQLSVDEKLESRVKRRKTGPSTQKPKHPPNSMIRVNYVKSESPTLTLLNAVSLIGNSSTLQTKSEPSPTLDARGTSKRLRKKSSDTLVTVSNEELPEPPIPAKRVKSSTVLQTPTIDELPRAGSYIPNVVRRGRQKNSKNRALNNSANPKIPVFPDIRVNQIDSNTACEAGLSTLSRRTYSSRSKSSTDNKANLSLDVRKGDNVMQPSLESQEIQAIFNGVDQDHKEGISISKTVDTASSDRKKRERTKAGEKRAESRQGIERFFKAIDTKDHVEDGFEKSMDKPERKRRKAARTTVASNDKTTENETMNGEFVKPRNRTPDPPQPVIFDLESTPKNRCIPSVRNKRGALRQIVKSAEKENNDEECKPKRGKKSVVDANLDSVVSCDDGVNVSQTSSPLRRGRTSVLKQSPSTPSTRTRHKILFTGLNSPELISIVQSLGGMITEKPTDCTALVTDKVRRTYKFLCAMAMAVPIVSVDWLKESKRKGRFLETADYVLEDAAEEAKFKFNLRRSLEMASVGKLLEGYTVVLTPNTVPPPNAEMKGIIQACGGKAVARPPSNWPEKSLIISRVEDLKNAKKFSTKAPKTVPLLSVEFILTGILRHELNFDEHKLNIE